MKIKGYSTDNMPVLMNKLIVCIPGFHNCLLPDKIQYLLHLRNKTDI